MTDSSLPSAAAPDSRQPDERQAPSSNIVLRRVLVLASVFAGIVAVVAAIIGFIVSGGEGVAGALVGAVLALLFSGVTAASILFANRFHRSEQYLAIFFGVVLGGWIVKFVVFLVAAFLLRDQPWLDPTVLFLTMVISVIGSLVIDVVVIGRSRIPVVSDLPPSRQ
jgi:hypothetical protein